MALGGKLGRSISRGLSKAEDIGRGAITDPKKALNAIVQGGLVPGVGVAGMLASPIAYLGGLQQGGWKGGSNAMDAMNSDPGEFWSDPANRSMMALTSAEIAALIASGGLATGAIGGTTTATATGATLSASEAAAVAGLEGVATTSASGLGLAGAAGLGAGAAAAGVGLASSRKKKFEAGIPPDLMDVYRNDPEQAKQFMRLRKSAAMLGRAGTIKAKGSSSLGGDQPLGTNLALTGA